MLVTQHPISPVLVSVPIGHLAAVRRLLGRVGLNRGGTHAAQERGQCAG
jgi:hypothetical protein